MTFKELIDKVRPIPLNDILNAHGLTGVKEGNSIRYKDEKSNIVVTGGRWYDNRTGTGGAGPIDLVSYLRGASFRDAVLWLSTPSHLVYSFSPTSKIKTTEEHKPLSYEESKEQYAARDNNRWSEAFSYLVDKRGLKYEVIDELFKKGDIYATEKGGVAFVHRNIDGEEVGSSIRSIHHQSGFRQSIGKKTTGWFSIGDLKKAKTVVIVESAIDALSLLSLSGIEPEMAIVAVSGAFSPLPLLRHAWENKARIVAAYDNDVPGSHAKEKLCQVWKELTGGHGEFIEKIPVKKDWNEDLCQRIAVVYTKMKF